MGFDASESNTTLVDTPLCVQIQTARFVLKKKPETRGIGKDWTLNSEVLRQRPHVRHEKAEAKHRIAAIKRFLPKPVSAQKALRFS